MVFEKKTDKSAPHLSDIVMSYGNLILMGSKMWDLRIDVRIDGSWAERRMACASIASRVKGSSYFYGSNFIMVYKKHWMVGWKHLGNWVIWKKNTDNRPLFKYTFGNG